MDQSSHGSFWEPGYTVLHWILAVLRCVWPYAFTAVGLGLGSVGTTCVTVGEACGPLGFPTGGVSALFVGLLALFFAAAEFCGRWNDVAGHEVNSFPNQQFS